MNRRCLPSLMVAGCAVLTGCSGGGEDADFDGWPRETLEKEGADLIEERSGERVGLTCNEDLPNDPTVLIACRAGDGRQFVFTATDDGELDVLVNDATPAPEPEDEG